MENEKKVAKDYWFIEDRLYSCDCVSDEPIKTDPCFKVIHCKEVLLSQESGICPACGTEFELESYTRCKELLVSELEQLRDFKKQAIELAEFYAKCDGFCADEECVCETKSAKDFLEKWGEK